MRYSLLVLILVLTTGITSTAAQKPRILELSSFATTEVRILGRYLSRGGGVLYDTHEEGPSRITITYG